MTMSFRELSCKEGHLRSFMAVAYHDLLPLIFGYNFGINHQKINGFTKFGGTDRLLFTIARALNGGTRTYE